MIRRVFWEQIGGMRPEFSLLADVDLWMRLAAQGPVGYVNEILITPRQDRPNNYPEEYKSTGWSWPRQRYLYEIHAANRLTYYDLRTLAGRMHWWYFRLRLSLETAKWLTYAVVRKKPAMISESNNSITAYDFWPLRMYRWILRKIYQNRGV